MHIRLTNGQPEIYSIGQLRRDNPQVSFPKNIPDAVLADYGVYPLRVFSEVTFDPNTHCSKQSQIVQVDGEWQLSYVVEPLPQETVEETMRAKRNKLLADSDWIVAKFYDQQEAIPENWAAYRQALRDVTLQPGFPYHITWPNLNV